MDEKSTDELRHEIRTATDMEDYLEKNRTHMLKESLADHLHMLLAQKNLRRAGFSAWARLCLSDFCG